MDTSNDLNFTRSSRKTRSLSISTQTRKTVNLHSNKNGNSSKSTSNRKRNLREVVAHTSTKIIKSEPDHDDKVNWTPQRGTSVSVERRFGVREEKFFPLRMRKFVPHLYNEDYFFYSEVTNESDLVERTLKQNLVPLFRPFSKELLYVCRFANYSDGGCNYRMVFVPVEQESEEIDKQDEGHESETGKRTLISSEVGKENKSTIGTLFYKGGHGIAEYIDNQFPEKKRNEEKCPGPKEYNGCMEIKDKRSGRQFKFESDIVTSEDINDFTDGMYISKHYSHQTLTLYKCAFHKSDDSDKCARELRSARCPYRLLFVGDAGNDAFLKLYSFGKHNHPSLLVEGNTHEEGFEVQEDERMVPSPSPCSSKEQKENISWDQDDIEAKFLSRIRLNAGKDKACLGSLFSKFEVEKGANW